MLEILKHTLRGGVRLNDVYPIEPHGQRDDVARDGDGREQLQDAWAVRHTRIMLERAERLVVVSFNGALRRREPIAVYRVLINVILAKERFWRQLGKLVQGERHERVTLAGVVA